MLQNLHVEKINLNLLQKPYWLQDWYNTNSQIQVLKSIMYQECPFPEFLCPYQHVNQKHNGAFALIIPNSDNIDNKDQWIANFYFSIHLAYW